MSRLTEDEAAAMVSSLSPEASAAWYAVMPMIGDDSNKFIGALIEAACVTAMAARCDRAAFEAGIASIWDDRAEAFRAPVQ